MPRVPADSLTGDRTKSIRLKMAQEEIDLIAAAAEAEGNYRDTWARETLVREARKSLKRHESKEK